MDRNMLFTLVCFLSLVYLSCTPRVVTPEQQVARVAEKVIDKPAQSDWEVEWEKTLQAARKEGKVAITTSSGRETMQALVRVMEERFGITLENVPMTGAQAAAKIVAERAAGLYLFDVIISGPTTLTELLIPAGALDPLEPVLILPEVKDPSKWWRGEIAWVTEKKDGLSFVATVNHPFLYNTGLVRKEELSSYWSLLEPKFKEKIVIRDPTVSGAGNSFFTAVAHAIMGVDYFKKLVEQKPAIMRDGRIQAEWVAKGKHLVGLGPSTDTVAEFIALGAPVARMVPKEGGYVSSGGATIGFMNKAPHRNAAKLFINFLLSKEGQDIWVVKQGAESMLLYATVEHLKPDQRRQPGVEYVRSDLGEFNEIKARYREIAKEIFAPLMSSR